MNPDMWPGEHSASLEDSFASLRGDVEFWQLDSIALASDSNCSERGFPPPTWQSQVAACHLGAQPDGPGAQHASVPYVLIQGPPGTGKTHTVKACPLVMTGSAIWAIS